MKKSILLVLICLFAAGVVMAGGNRESRAGGIPSGSFQGAAGDIVNLGGVNWRVLDVKDGNALVLSEKILFKMPYHVSSRRYIGESGDFFVADPVTWEECDLRKYLNGDFYVNSLTGSDRERIAEVTVKNENNPWYNTPCGNDTKDKVFLLSIEEAMQYLGGELPKPENISPFSSDGFHNDGFNPERIAEDLDGQAGWWWFRTAGGNYYCGSHQLILASIAMANGGLFVQGEFVTNNNGGVRPAMWLKM